MGPIMSVRSWFQPGYRLLLMFFAITSVLVSALAWMGWKLVEQDRLLAGQRMEDRCDHAADLAAAALKDDLSRIEDRLAQVSAASPPKLQERAKALAADFPEDSALLVYSSGPVEAYPTGRLLFVPDAPAPSVASAAVFSHAEKLEFQEHQYLEAASSLRRLVRSPDRTIGAEALARLGRCLWKGGSVSQALAAYQELKSAGPVSVGGLPAELVAREARLLILERQKSDEAPREASELREALCAGRWRINRASFEFYMDESARILGTDSPLPPTGVSAAAGIMLPQWQALSQRQGSTSGRRTFRDRDGPLLLLWRGSSERMAALALGVGYIRANWLGPLNPTLAPMQVKVVLTDIDGRAVAGELTAGSPSSVRPASATQLPWTVYAVSANPAEAGPGARRLILTGVLTLLLLVLGGGYFVGRAAVREVAVARLQSEFVASVSHELRTPVTAMRQLSELLATGRVAGGQDRDDYYRALQKESERLHRLVEGLLTFGRMEAGAGHLRFEPLDPAQLARTVIDEFHREGAAPGYHVDLKVDAGVSRVRADRAALSCVLWNLLDNAVKYSPECQTVWAEVAQEYAHVAVRVRDRGIGIPPGERRKIFRRFVRGSAARDAGIRGVGVGLAMVQLIVAAHQGRIRVESRLGEGSVFTVLLPAYADPGEDRSCS
jgi:signal transduction histidine kinase